MFTTSDIAKKLFEVKTNPASVQRVNLKLLEALTDGKVIIYDSTSPYAIMGECSANNMSVAISEVMSVARVMYPIASVSPDDIHRHMSDVDFKGIFSTPGDARFAFAFNWQSLVNAAIPDESNPAVRKVLIPKHTYIHNGVHQFTFQYPLWIKIYPNLSVQASWDVSELSPLQSITSTHVPIRFATQDNVTYLSFTVDLQQIALTSKQDSISSIGGHHQTYQFNDQFYYCRAFVKNSGQNSWEEIRTTHADGIYNPKEATMLLKVVGNTVTTTIPQLYTTNGLVNNSIRVDIYTTAGKVDYVQDGFSDRSFQVTFQDIDRSSTISKYMAPLIRLDGIKVWGIGAVVGGADGLTFDEIRSRYILRQQNGDSLVITPDQLESYMSSQGYGLMLSVDNLTNRRFLAVRSIPATISGYGDDQAYPTVSGMGMSIGLLQETMTQLGAVNGVLNNGDRLTILPKCLFIRENGTLKLVQDLHLDQLMDRNVTSPDKLVSIVNGAEYLFSPFHYRLSATSSSMDVDAYYLTSPTIDFKHGVFANDRAEVFASTGDYRVSYSENNDGYFLDIEVTGDSTLSQIQASNVHVQLSFVSDQGGQRAFITGTLESDVDPDTGLVEDAYIYRFHIKSNMDIDVRNMLYIHDDALPVNLTKVFDLIIAIENYLPTGTYQTTQAEYFDKMKFNNYTHGASYLVITREEVSIRFGDWLEHLWQRFRSVPELTKYQTYESDVEATWQQNVYHLDNGLVVFEPVPGGQPNEVRPKLKHAKGTSILDDNNDPVIRHAKGSIVTDSNNNPIPLGGIRGVVRQLELLLFDARYYFATDTASGTYLTRSIETLKSWIVDDLPTIEEDVIIQSSLLYYPKVNMDYTEVTVDDGDVVTLHTSQRISVDYYMTSDKYENSEIRDRIESVTPKLVNDVLANTSLSIQMVEEKLRESMGDDIIGVSISNLFDDKYKMVTLNDPSTSLNLGKRLVVRSNLELQVANDIDIRFHNHTTRKK